MKVNFAIHEQHAVSYSFTDIAVVIRKRVRAFMVGTCEAS